MSKKIAFLSDTKNSAKTKFKNTFITQVPANILPTPNPSLPELVNPFQTPESSPSQDNTIEPITPNEQNGNPVLKKNSRITDI